MRSRITVSFTRESVCMGDDITAPNAATFEFEPTTPLPDILTESQAQHYLASVAGDVTWSVWLDEQLLAVVRVPTAQPPSVIFTPAAANLTARDVPSLYFAYHCDAGPVAVLHNPKLRR